MRPRHVLLGFALATLVAPATAQPARRVKDINTSGNSTAPQWLQASESRLYFVASTGPSDGLWVSDGSADGTVLVPGTSGATRPMPMGDRVFFMRNFWDLWVSDGTSAGTLLLKANAQIPNEWVVSSGKLYFAASGGELWMSDGTPAGTQRVKEPDPGTGPLGAQHLAAVGARVYFIAFKDGVNALWTTDGTSAGTHAVQDSPVAVGSVTDPPIAALGSTVFFGGTEPTRGLELWASDGTDSGTTLFADLNPGSASSYPSQLVVSGGLLYFTAFTSGVGWRLWVSNGTPAGTRPLDAGGAFFDASDFRELADAGGTLVYRTEVNYGTWTSDGTDAGTVLLRPDVSRNLTAVGSKAFFTVGSQLWVTDLTPAGTHHVRSFSNVFSGLGDAFAGQLFFVADDGVVGPQLWKSDGTSAGTTLVRVIHPGFGSSYPGSFCEAAGALFFAASTYDPANGFRPGLWKTDGTETGTLRVSDFSGQSWVSLGPRLAFPGPGAGPLWETDGTPGGAFRVPGQPDSLTVYNRQLVASGGRAFWFAGDGSGSLELWAIDPAAPPAASRIGSFPQVSDLATTPEGVMFGAATMTGGLLDLWKSDGTPAGTRLVRAFGSYQPIQIQRVGARWFLALAVPPARFQVWVTDGRAAGTQILLEFDGTLSGVGFAGSLRGQALFWVSLPTGGAALWRSDGTEAGTFVLHTFAGGFSGAITATADGGFFSVSSDAIRFSQLWVTDGSVAGTRLVRDFSDLPGNPPPSVGAMFDVAGTLVFGLSNNEVKQLWRSDGSTTGTLLLQDLVTAEIQQGPIVAFGSDVFFAGSDPYAGSEPWAIPLAAGFTPRPTALSLLNPCRLVDTRSATAFLGGPAVTARVPRVFPVGDACGIPWTARALAANVTVAGATADGLLRIHASDIGAPEASVINFRAGQTRANNATVALGPDAEFTVRLETSSGTGEAHVIVDVVGWYE